VPRDGDPGAPTDLAPATNCRPIPFRPPAVRPAPRWQLAPLWRSQLPFERLAKTGVSC
jgi:hypothetical protein